MTDRPRKSSQEGNYGMIVKNKIGNFLFLFVLNIVVIEFLLQGLSLASPRLHNILTLPEVTETPFTVPDDQLVVRGNPKYPELDGNGFHNRKLPIKGNVAIVTLGDSQTYGTENYADWPEFLSQKLNANVYNMSFPGYGPFQSLVLMDKAIELHPRAIIEALYTGNDLADSYFYFYDFKKRSFEGFRPANAEQAQLIADAEKKGKISDLAEQEGHLAYKDDRIRAHSFFRKLLSRYSRIYGLIRAIRHLPLFKFDDVLWQQIKKEASSTSSKREIFESRNIRTVFTARYRLIALDKKDPRITEGLRLSLEAIKQMNSKANKAGIQYWVIIIPTKEYVFRDMVMKKAESASENYKDLVDSEGSYLKKIEDFLTEQKIHYVNVGPCLSQALNKNISVYSMTWDGHPTAKGQQVIADFLGQTFQKIAS